MLTTREDLYTTDGLRLTRHAIKNFGLRFPEAQGPERCGSPEYSEELAPIVRCKTYSEERIKARLFYVPETHQFGLVLYRINDRVVITFLTRAMLVERELHVAATRARASAVHRAVGDNRTARQWHYPELGPGFDAKGFSLLVAYTFCENKGLIKEKLTYVPIALADASGEVDLHEDQLKHCINIAEAQHKQRNGERSLALELRSLTGFRALVRMPQMYSDPFRALAAADRARATEFCS